MYCVCLIEFGFLHTVGCESRDENRHQPPVYSRHLPGVDLTFIPEKNYQLSYDCEIMVFIIYNDLKFVMLSIYTKQTFLRGIMSPKNYTKIIQHNCELY